MVALLPIGAIINAEAPLRKKAVAFLNKTPAKDFCGIFSRDAPTFPGRKQSKVFCGAFLQKSDPLFAFLERDDMKMNRVAVHLHV
jgi:hypothetical protein